MANSYVVGTLVRMTATFSISGVDTDPSTVTCQVKDPAGVTTSPAPTKDSVGVYHADFVTALPGVHYYRWVGTGGLTVAGEGAFTVLESKLA